MAYGDWGRGSREELLTAIASWRPWRAGAAVDTTNAQRRVTRFTNGRARKRVARTSPDGKLVAFLADRDGELDIWVSQGVPDLSQPHGHPDDGRRGYRTETSFSADSSEIGFNPGDGNRDPSAMDGRHATGVPC